MYGGAAELAGYLQIKINGRPGEKISVVMDFSPGLRNSVKFMIIRVKQSKKSDKIFWPLTGVPCMGISRYRERLKDAPGGRSVHPRGVFEEFRDPDGGSSLARFRTRKCMFSCSWGPLLGPGRPIFRPLSRGRSGGSTRNFLTFSC